MHEQARTFESDLIGNPCQWTRTTNLESTSDRDKDAGVDKLQGCCG